MASHKRSVSYFGTKTLIILYIGAIQIKITDVQKYQEKNSYIHIGNNSKDIGLYPHYTTGVCDIAYTSKVTCQPCVTGVDQVNSNGVRKVSMTDIIRGYDYRELGAARRIPSTRYKNN